MATVYLAQDRRHHRRVAVKVLNWALGASMSAERFLREIRLTASLAHPHVLPLHDSGEADGLLYYVMPYVEGETLRARLVRDGCLSIVEATRLLRELADALAHAHGRGVIHRDLKPENILLAGGHAVVADFGIARAVREARETSSSTNASGVVGTLTEAGVSLGTPAYMSPEQAAGGDATNKSDLYALGVIAYEMLGAHPFDVSTPQAMIAAHIAQTPPPLATRRRDVPPSLAALVMQLLAKDPADRPRDAVAVLNALDGAALPVGSISRRMTYAAAAMLFVGLSIGAYALWQRATTTGTARGSTPVISSVAVMPFTNTSGNPQDDFFGDGLADELAHALSNRPGLRLAGHDASYSFKGRRVTPQAIGKSLGVDAIVSATVRRAGDRLRINPQLVSTSDGTVLWDGVYESASRDMFAVQDSLTRAVVAALANLLAARSLGEAKIDSGPRPVTTSASRGTRDAEAYELYLKGMYYWHERGAKNVARSIELFQQAIARDPTFARGYAALSSGYAVLTVYVPDPTDSIGSLATASAQQAISLDSTLTETQLAMATVLARTGQWKEAEARYRTALRIEPSNQFAHHNLGTILVRLGRTNESLDELRLAVRLDPLAKSARTMLAEALIDARRFKEAEDEAQRVLVIDSTFQLALNSLGFAQALNGQPDSAVRTLERGVQLYPFFEMFKARLFFAFAVAGRWEEARRLRADLARPGADRSGGIVPAFADFVLGKREPLLQMLATPAGQRQWFALRGGGCNPMSDPLWADAEYKAMMGRLGVGPCPLAQPWPFSRLKS